MQSSTIAVQAARQSALALCFRPHYHYTAFTPKQQFLKLFLCSGLLIHPSELGYEQRRHLGIMDCVNLCL